MRTLAIAKKILKELLRDKRTLAMIRNIKTRVDGDACVEYECLPSSRAA